MPLTLARGIWVRCVSHPAPHRRYQVVGLASSVQGLEPLVAASQTDMTQDANPSRAADPAHFGSTEMTRSPSTTSDRIPSNGTPSLRRSSCSRSHVDPL